MLAENIDWVAEAAGAGAPWYGAHRERAAVPGSFAAIAGAANIERPGLIGCTTSASDLIVTVRWPVGSSGSEYSAKTVAAFASSNVDPPRTAPLRGCRIEPPPGSPSGIGDLRAPRHP